MAFQNRTYSWIAEFVDKAFRWEVNPFPSSKQSYGMLFFLHKIMLLLKVFVHFSKLLTVFWKWGYYITTF